MRRILLLIIISCLTLNLLRGHGLIHAAGKKKSDGGSGSFYSNLCYSPSPHIVLMKVVPDKFPFKIKNITLSNASENGMNIYFTGYLSMSILQGIWDKSYSLLTNQVIYQNSPLLDNDGNLKIFIDYSAFFCIEGAIYSPSNQTFQLRSTVEIENYDSANGTISGLETKSITLATDVLRNDDNGLPYQLSLPYPGGQSIHSVPGFSSLPNVSLTSRTQKTGNPIQKTVNLSTYPNPVEKSLILDFILLENANIEIKVLNAKGQIIYNPHEEKKYNEGRHKLKIDISSLPSGIYLIQFAINKYLYTRKILKN